MKEHLTKEIVDAYDAFIAELNHFNEEDFNKPPLAGSWTPGQVADHIFKSTKALPDRHPVAANRPYDEKVGALEKTLLNFESKLKAPEMVSPNSGPFDKNQMIAQLSSVREKQKLRIEERDLTELCEGFALPFAGTMTRYEWLKFFILHIKRHTHQLQRMQSTANN